MKRIFVAAWEYPPKMSGESIVCKRTLENSKFCYDVCCGKFKNENIKYNDDTNIKVFPLKGRYIIWPINVLKSFLQLDKKTSYRIMMSRVMPANGHLAGLLIKLFRPKIKWVVYFSDPVWNSPFISIYSIFKKNNSQRPNYILMKMFGIPAYIATIWGDLLVFNNERLARYILGKRYDKYRYKTVIAPYGHEGVDGQPEKLHKRKDNKITITHVGQVYGARTFKYVVQALELLKVHEKELYENIQMVQVGFICQSDKEFIAKSKVNECFKFVEQVGYEESLQYMRKTDYALILDPVFDDDKKNIYVPVKIFDYMSVGTQIIAVTDENSATADIVKEIDCPMATNNVDAILALLINCINKQSLNYVCKYDKFNCKQGIEKVDQKFTELFNGKI